MIQGEQQFFNALIVDNEQKICDLICLFLGSTGRFKIIVSANNAVQAMQKLQNQHFDILITDHSMSGKNGIELIGNLARTPKFRAMKFLLVSGCLTRDDVAMAFSEGGKHILVKPFSRAQLLKKLGEVLKVRFG